MRPKHTAAINMPTPSEQIDKQIADLADWRGQRMTALRELINEADPKLSEDWKRDKPLWTAKGNVLAPGAFKNHLKIKFFKGGSLHDPRGPFNPALDAQEPPPQSP